MPHTASTIRILRAATVAGAAVTCLTSAAAAQRAAEPLDLHGSKSSVEKMYAFAVGHHMQFYLTPETLDDAIAKGLLVPLTGDSTYELTRGVGFSYARKEVRDFVTALAPQYLAACGTPLTVTSAARPITRQPHNANPHSVHPTGIAVDLRRPAPGPCLNWVRGALATLEEQGYIEATEEHHPVHLHIAVLTEPGRALKLPVLYSGTPVPRIVVPDSIAPIAPAPAFTRVASATSAPAPSGVDYRAMEGGDVPTRIRASGGRVESYSAGEVALTSTKKGATPTSVASKASVASSSARTYRVRQGDTLWEVAQRNGVTVKRLAAVNHIGTHKALKPGVTLQLPAGR